MEANNQSFFYNCFYSMDSDPKDILTFFSKHLPRRCGAGKLAIADIGCGTGRMTGLFAGIGHDVTGYEPDGNYYMEAKKLECENIRVENKGFLEIDEDSRYDAMLAVNGPFEYLLTPDDRSEALRRCNRALKPGGIVFIEAVNFLLILKNFKPMEDETVEFENSRVVKRSRHEFDFAADTMTHYDYFEHYRDGKMVEKADKTHRFGMFSLSELEFLLKLNGFGEIEHFNSYGGDTPEKPNDYRIRVSARKAE
ncbi:MAG: hypothetical protein A2Y33_13295 [Spirochaetes bacterium GWF1_51_8]|nr:MAG: hypothetical protein A2Y33_13295 [Spirochaetes bacterium GWF1_51_8]